MSKNKLSPPNNLRQTAKSNDLISAAQEQFHLTDKEAEAYTDKWEEIFADRLRTGWYPAFVRPAADGTVDIEIFGHKISDE